MENKQSRTTFRLRLETMIQRLREGILSGQYPAGSYLPSEDVLGEQFQLSKKSVRKGLESLVEENLIIKKAKIGNMVSLPSADDDKISIRFCYYSSSEQDARIHLLLDEFERKYPHIQVKRMTMHIDTYAQQAVEFMNEQMLDVIMVNYHHFRHFQMRDELRYFAEQQVQLGSYPMLNKAFTADDRLYVKPFIFSPVILCYNKQHFLEAGLQEPDSSWTWKEFAHAVDKLTDTSPESKRLGFFFHLLSQNRWPLWLLQNGFKLQQNKLGAYKLDTKAFAESAKLIKELFSRQRIIPSFMSENDFDTEKLFLEEKVSMIITTYFSLNNMKSVPFEYDISPVPYADSPYTLLLNIGLAMNAQSSEKEASQLLVDYLTSHEAQAIVRENTLSIPSLKEAAELEFHKKEGEPSRFRMFREIIPTFRYYTDLHAEASQLHIMTYYLKLYWSNMDTLDNVMASIEHALNDKVEFV